jgi:hypothetical protein
MSFAFHSRSWADVELGHQTGKRFVSEPLMALL